MKLLVVMIGLFIALILAFFVMTSRDNSARQAVRTQYEKDCKVIGDSQDLNEGSTYTRTIFQCPDGMIHIM